MIETLERFRNFVEHLQAYVCTSHVKCYFAAVYLLYLTTV